MLKMPDVLAGSREDFNEAIAVAGHVIVNFRNFIVDCIVNPSKPRFSTRNTSHVFADELLPVGLTAC